MCGVHMKGPLQLMSLMKSLVNLDNRVGMVWSKLDHNGN